MTIAVFSEKQNETMEVEVVETGSASENWDCWVDRGWANNWRPE